MQTVPSDYLLLPRGDASGLTTLKYIDSSALTSWSSQHLSSGSFGPSARRIARVAHAGSPRPRRSLSHAAGAAAGRPAVASARRSSSGE